MNKAFLDKVRLVIAAVDNDNNGTMGRGGNGGLISRETMRACDELRVLLEQIEREQLPAIDAD